MNDERDPLLESLFAEAAVEPADDGFNNAVMENVRRRRRNVLIGRVAVVALIVVLELILSSPLQNSIGAMTAALSVSLVDLQAGWFASVVAPINSVAGLIGMLLLGIHTLVRKMIH
jgi:hypothetical protein